MKIYSTKLDNFGYPIDNYRFLCDTRLLFSGTKLELKLTMKLWNFIARIVNLVKIKL